MSERFRLALGALRAVAAVVLVAGAVQAQPVIELPLADRYLEADFPEAYRIGDGIPRGDLVVRFGRQGEGPGEFRDASEAFALPDGRTVVPDEGEYAGSFASTPMPAAFGPDGLVAYVEVDALDVANVVVRWLPEEVR